MIPDVVASQIAVQVVKFVAFEGNHEVVESQLHIFALLCMVDEFLDAFGAGGVHGRQPVGHTADVELLQGNVPLQGGKLLCDVKLAKDVAFQIRVADFHGAVVQAVLIVGGDVHVSKRVVVDIQTLDGAVQMRGQGLEVLRIQAGRGHISFYFSREVA